MATGMHTNTNGTARQMLKLICYHSPLFKAHWAFFIPDLSDHDCGSVVNVIGTLLQGFIFEIKRDHRLDETSRRFTLFDVGVMESQDLQIDGRFEEYARSVPAPEGSLRSSDTGGDIVPKQLAEVRDCQFWVYQVVQKLVEHGLLEQEALENLDKVAKH